MRQIKGNSSGFTLIELSIGLTLWVVVTLSVTRIFQSGLKSFKHAQVSAPLQQEARIVLDQIAREFRNSIDVPGLVWSENGQDITFATLDESADLLAPHAVHSHIHKVTYQLAELPRTYLRRLTQELTSTGIQAPVETVLTTYPTAVHWDYAYISAQGGIEWFGAWNASNRAVGPCGIRVQLTLFDLSGQPNVFTRTVFLPTARSLPRVP